MIKFFKISLLLLLASLISNCSYKPILSNQNYEFSIEKTEINGDEEVNSFIERSLKKLKKSNKKNKYYVNIETSKIKKTISNDSKGDPSKLEIIIISNFQISNSEKLLVEKKLKVKNNYNNISDKLKLKKYELIIIENLSKRISNNIVSSIIKINDN